MLANPDSNPPRRRPPYGIYAYTAREWDPETNLYYYRARYYDPKIGRFISEDPAAARHTRRSLGGPDGQNVHPAAVVPIPRLLSFPANHLYAYAANSPSVYYDPMGTAGIAIPPWAQWVKLFLWDLPGALCLPDYYKCQKKAKEQCACRGRWRTTCEFWGYDCCFEEWNQCRADFFRVKGDPVKERRNPCYAETEEE